MMKAATFLNRARGADATGRRSCRRERIGITLPGAEIQTQSPRELHVAASRTMQRGFSLVTAIFLVVVLSGLGAAMMTFFTAQQQGSALDVLGARAYRAARAGIEWGAFQVVQNSGVGFAPACRTGITAQSLPALAGTLADFAVNVNCSAISAVDAAPLWVYSLTSTATRGAAGSADYVERQISATIAQ
ncbi:MAG: agglutinin biogenesis protein MshP [Nitrosomonadales bacterium]|nr:agglutinin biogenesis protein MshP [Nitrosomonadales bacterium]